MGKKLKTLELAAALAVVMAFVGCGDENSTSPTTEKIYDSNLIVESFNDLVECTDKQEGSLAYVKGEKAEYICEEGEWVADAEDGSSEASATSNSSSVESTASSSSIASTSSSSRNDNQAESSGDACNDIAEAQRQGSECNDNQAEDSSSSSELVSSSSYVKGAWDYLNPKMSYGLMIDARDNQPYKTIVIGEQTWMAENLNYSDSVTTPSLLGSSWCYENSADSCAKYGRLYTWAAAIDSVALANDANNPTTCGYGRTCSLPDTVQGICPKGWHLPDSTEWSMLIAVAGGEDNAGKILKSTSGWNNDGNGTDAFGFSALPAGGSYSYFFRVGECAYFWTSTEGDNESSDYRYLDHDKDYAKRYYRSKDNGISIRCLRD